MRNVVGQHRRNEPSVVDLDSLDLMGNHELPPMSANGLRIRQKRRRSLDQTDSPVRLGRRQAEPSPGGRRSRGGVPELGQVLQHHAEPFAPMPQNRTCLSSKIVLGITRMDGAEQNAGIEQPHCYQS
jgi:hypothetical protein